MKTVVWITTQFQAFHRWENAPDDVSFLRDFHRHIFHVKLGFDVLHDDRQIEFFQQKRRIDNYIEQNFKDKKFSYSCEMIAYMLLKDFNAVFAEVSEDGENGAVVTTEQTEKQNLLPALQKKNRCFYGTEAEGPYKGAFVLFVPGCIDKQELEKVLKTDIAKEVGRIYYGAGNQRNISVECLCIIRDFARKNDDTFIDIEIDDCSIVSSIVDLFDETLDAWNIILFCNKPLESSDYEKIPKIDFIKTIEKGVIYWHCTHDNTVYTTAINDPIFSQDKYIEV